MCKTRSRLVFVYSFVCVFSLACSQPRPAATPAPAFVCQKSCDLRTPIGPAPLIVHTSAQLLQLAADTPYKYVVTADGQLVVAPVGANVPNNVYHHPVLAQGQPIRTGGQLIVRHNHQRVLQVFASQETYSYCATLASLAAVESALGRAGVARPLIARLDRSPGCTPKLR